MIQQNTSEWLDYRKDKIGASDAPIIMKASPFKTPYQLWREKVNLSEPEQETYPQAEGKRKEPIAKQAMEKELGMPLRPQIKLHSQRSWMMASLDAISDDQSIIGEIKCPGKFDHESALAGHVPEKYYPQLQHQIEVCSVEFAYYFSFYESSGILLKVYRDDKYIKTLLAEEEKFWECIQNFDAPELLDRDYVHHTDARWMHLAERLKDIKEIYKEEEKIKQELISLANGQNSMGAGIKVSKCTRKGSVDYSKIPELKNIDLESYRKKTTEYWRIA